MTKIVEKEKVVEKPVEKVVKETVVVEKQVEKVVEKTVVVEKEAQPAQLPKMKLRFGYGGWAKDYADIMIANFQTTEPNVEVEIEVIAGDLIQVLYTQAAAGTTGNVQWIADAHVMNLGDAGVMLDMTPLAQADPVDITADIYPVMLGLGKWQDKWYMIPWAADAPVMYYNKTMLEKNGVPLPDPLKGYTVQEFQEACKKVTNEKEQVYGWNGMDSMSWWAIMCQVGGGFGGQFYSGRQEQFLLDTPEAMECILAIADIACARPLCPMRQLWRRPFHSGKSLFSTYEPHPTARTSAPLMSNSSGRRRAASQPGKHTAGAGTWCLASPRRPKRARTSRVEVASTNAMPARKSTLPVIPLDPCVVSMPRTLLGTINPPRRNRDGFLEIPNIAITPPNPLARVRHSLCR